MPNEVTRSKIAPSRRALSEVEIAKILEQKLAMHISRFDAPRVSKEFARAILAADPVERAVEVKDTDWTKRIARRLRDIGDSFIKARGTNVNERRLENWCADVNALASALETTLHGMRDGSEDGPCASKWIGTCDRCGEEFDGGSRNQPSAHVHSTCKNWEYKGTITYTERPATPKQASGDPAVDHQDGPVVPVGEHKPVAAHWIGKCKICGETFDGGDRNEPPAHTHGRCGGLIRYHRAAPPAPQKPSDDVVALLRDVREVLLMRVGMAFKGGIVERIDAILSRDVTP